MRSLTTFPALFLLLLLLMAVTPVSIAWNANRPGTGSDPPSLPTADGGDATVLSTTVPLTTVLQPGEEAVADSTPAVNGDASSSYPDRVSGDDVTDVPSPDQPLTASDAASPSSDVDDGTEEDVSSSTSPVDDSTVVAPSRPSSENVDPSPQKSISDDDAISSNSTESLSAAQLKANLDLAEGTEKTAKDEFDKAQKELEKKKGEAIEPNREYEDKKQEWEELDGISAEKKRAEKEYNDAVAALNLLQIPFNTAATNYKAVNDSIQRAADELVEIPKWPGELILEERKRDVVANRKPSATELDTWRGAVLTTAEALKTVQTTYNDTKDLYEADECTNPANTGSAACKGVASNIATLQPLVERAQTDYNTAAEKVSTAEKTIEEADRDLIPINARIKELKDWITYRTKTEVEAEQKPFIEDQPIKKAAFDGAKTKRDEAAEAVEKAKTAKETADQSDGGLSVAIVRRNALRAEGIKDTAEKAKIAKDKEVVEAQNALTKAESSYKEAQAVVAKLSNRYDVQKRKEDEAQRKRSLGAILGGIGGAVAVVLIIAGIVVFVIVWRRRKDARKKKPENVESKVAKHSRTPARLRASSTSAARSCLPPATNSNTPSQTPSNVEGAASAAETAPNTPNTPTKINADAIVELGPITGPFIPGSEPYKIPAKHFKWEGALKRRSRWHGAPDHDLEGQEGVRRAPRIYFDPSANTATEIGPTEIMEDAGPASDSDRSEFLANLSDWERKHVLYMAERRKILAPLEAQFVEKEEAMKKEAAEQRKKEAESKASHRANAESVKAKEEKNHQQAQGGSTTPENTQTPKKTSTEEKKGGTKDDKTKGVKAK